LIPTDIITYRDKLREGGRAISTVNITVKKIISGPFREAHLQGHILVNPVASVKNLKEQGKKPKSIKEPFSRDEVVKLLSKVQGEWRGLILLGATTGLRLGDAASLKWGDIKKGFIKLTTQKTGQVVELPIHSDLAAFLKEQTRGIGLAPVFPELSKRKQAGRSGLSRQFRAIMDKARVKAKEVAAHGEAGRTRFSKGFHSLRHTFISSLANAGVSADVRQKLSAHSDESVHLDYTHLEKETFRKAVKKYFQ
jgi:integrase